MKFKAAFFGCGLLCVGLILSGSVSAMRSGEVRIAVVSRYHQEYRWSQETNRGVVAAFRHFGFLDKDAQGKTYTKTDRVESARLILRKFWMDTKRRSTTPEIRQSAERVMRKLAEFHPDLILLGDDNAAHYIGNQYIDTEIPVVFWGLDINPLKDANGETVDPLTAGRWFLENLRKPSVSYERQSVEEGFFCAVDDSGFKQGFEAVRIAHRILDLGESAEQISAYAPARGSFVVNLERAQMLGLSQLVQRSSIVEETIPRALALQPAPASRR